MISLEMKIIRVSSKNLKRVIKKAVELIRRGGVIVFPTDTVYGLIADAKNEKAVQKVFRIKKRFPKKPIPVFVKDLKMTRSLAEINKTQEKFLKKIWPGKVTAILKIKPKAKKIFPKGIVNSKNKIGLRTPNYKFINQLLKILNFPLTGTSANISGKKESTEIKEVLDQFEGRKFQPDLILDFGDLKPSLTSTAIDLTNFEILREGAISKNEIYEILAKIKI